LVGYIIIWASDTLAVGRAITRRTPSSENRLPGPPPMRITAAGLSSAWVW
jgi:hypothetical protein